MEDSTIISTDFSLEEWMHSPLKDSQISQVDSNQTQEEWIESDSEVAQWEYGELVEKNGITVKHSRIQANLVFYWRSFRNSYRLGGEVYTDAPCCTNLQGRRPDVAYLTPELLDELGEPDVFPQSFPLVAEIVSTLDSAEEVIAKSQEYLQSGSEEVWLLFPETRWIILVTSSEQRIFTSGQVIHTQKILKGFSIGVDELLA